jgi:hypothetical protein
MKFIVAFFLFILAASAPSAAPLKQVWPEQVKDILSNTDELELISLDPSKEGQYQVSNLFGWRILGKTKYKRSEDSGKALLSAWEKAISNEGRGAKCFWPRHAIHAEHNNKTVDLLLCFECQWVYVYLDGKRTGWTKFRIDKSIEPQFDKLLKDANVPLAKKAK